MKAIYTKNPFTLIEIICAIVILSFSLTSLVVAVNQNMMKVYTSSIAVKCVIAAENKLMQYRIMKWSEIPPSDEGTLMPTESEAYRFQMASEFQQNEYGNFIHVVLKVSFPAARTTDTNGFILETDVAVPASDAKGIDEAVRNRSLGL